MNKLIGLAGNATVGKDTFCKLLTEANPDFKRFAFADFLKHEVSDILRHNFGLNVYNNEDKIFARDFLVSWGHLRREQTEGKYFINLLEEEIRKVLFNRKYVVPVITDVRFATYPYDELNFVKDTGILVYIDKYYQSYDNVGPANEKEAYNNPILKQSADYLFEWQDCGGDYSIIKSKYFNKVKEFIEWFQIKS